MSEHTIGTAREAERTLGASLQVWFDSADHDQMRRWLGDNVALRPQSNGNLGHKMSHAFESAFARGSTACLAIGTDSPDLTVDHLRRAFDAMEHADVVVGPAADGGYYLIGLSRRVPSLFVDIPWGTGDVLAATLSIAASTGLEAHQLDTLVDIDRPSDLGRVPLHLRAATVQRQNDSTRSTLIEEAAP